MKTPHIPFSHLLASVTLVATAMLWASPEDEIDLSASDDSAEERENSTTVDRTPDGFIDVTCDDATVASVLQQFRRSTRMNILSSDSTNLQRRVSASLYHVPWNKALQSILGLANFKITERDSIWYVTEKTDAEIKHATRYYVLKHASAADLADLFNGVAMKTSYEERNSIRALRGKDEKDAATPANEGDKDFKSAIAGKAHATAFPNTNTLVLSGPEANLIECEEIINELDRPVTQVYIEARFIELSTEAMHKLGIQWDQLKSWGATAKGIKAGYQASTGTAADYGSGLTTKTTNNNVNDNSNSSTSIDGDGKTTANATSTKTSTSTGNENYTGLFPSSIGEAAGAGATAADMAWENAATFSGQLSADDFSLAISAFEQMQEGKMFSNPRIIVANGKEARVDMTTKEPNVEVKSEYGNQYATTPTVSTELKTIPGTDKNLFAGEAFFSYGITLSVKPRVSSTGLIAVEVVPTISEKKGDKMVAGASAESVYTTYPIINIKTINTEFTMKDGATAVIGGLTQTEEKDVDSGIPYLRKLPWIGQKLFGWQSRQKVQSEILVLVTVGIANPETLRKDAGLPTNAVLGREYVEGRRLEPGERPGAVKDIQNVDTRTLDAIREDPYPYANDDEDAFGDDESFGGDTKSEPKKADPQNEEPKPAEPEKKAEPEQPAKPEPEAAAPAAEEPKPEPKKSNRCRRRKR